MSNTIQEALKLISQGVYVISVSNGRKHNAFTAAWVMQASFNPLLICFSINPKHYSYQLLKEHNRCCISILDNEQYLEADHFGHSTSEDKMAGYQWMETENDTLAFAESLAYFDCRVEHYTQAGDHMIAVCSVVDAAVINEGEPMLYRDTDDMDGSGEFY